MNAVTIAFILATGFTQPNGNQIFITVPAIASESECHRVALDLGAPKHKCIEYQMAVPEIDAVGIADAIQDAEQDEG
jgi:hypothetical protein